MSDGPYLFDVGVTAVAHAGTPVSEPALSYVRRAVRGEIDAVVPHASLFGAHVILTSYYGFTNDDAARVLTNFRDARRLCWYEGVSEGLLRDGLAVAADANVDGWDGYYAQVAQETGVATVLTLDDDLEGLGDFETEVVLSPDEFARLNEYMDR